MHFLYEDVCSHLEDVHSPTSVPAEEHMMVVVAEHPQTVNVAEEGDCSVCDRWQNVLIRRYFQLFPQMIKPMMSKIWVELAPLSSFNKVRYSVPICIRRQALGAGVVDGRGELRRVEERLLRGFRPAVRRAG